MAIKWHLISEDVSENGTPSYGIVFHADVPDQNNAANYSIRSQVKESMNPEATQVPKLVETQTEADMLAGLIYEHLVSIGSFPGETSSSVRGFAHCQRL